jgi:hypothetical protein
VADAIRVEGLAELQRAFTAADRALREDLRDALTEAAQPVRSDAQTLAATTISHMTTNRTTDWTRMRTGIVAGTVVYVAPAERGSKGRGNQRYRRRRFKDVLGPRMDFALARNRDRVIRRLDLMLGEVKAVWERYG